MLGWATDRFLRPLQERLFKSFGYYELSTDTFHVNTARVNDLLDSAAAATAGTGVAGPPYANRDSACAPRSRIRLARAEIRSRGLIQAVRRLAGGSIAIESITMEWEVVPDTMRITSSKDAHCTEASAEAEPDPHVSEVEPPGERASDRADTDVLSSHDASSEADSGASSDFFPACDGDSDSDRMSDDDDLEAYMDAGRGGAPLEDAKESIGAATQAAAHNALTSHVDSNMTGSGAKRQDVPHASVSREPTLDTSSPPPPSRAPQRPGRRRLPKVRDLIYHARRALNGAAVSVGALDITLRVPQTPSSAAHTTRIATSDREVVLHLRCAHGFRARIDDAGIDVDRLAATLRLADWQLFIHRVPTTDEDQGLNEKDKSVSKTGGKRSSSSPVPLDATWLDMPLEDLMFAARHSDSTTNSTNGTDSGSNAGPTVTASNMHEGEGTVSEKEEKAAKQNCHSMDEDDSCFFSHEVRLAITGWQSLPLISTPIPGHTQAPQNTPQSERRVYITARLAAASAVLTPSNLAGLTCIADALCGKASAALSATAEVAATKSATNATSSASAAPPVTGTAMSADRPCHYAEKPLGAVAEAAAVATAIDVRRHARVFLDLALPSASLTLVTATGDTEEETARVRQAVGDAWRRAFSSAAASFSQQRSSLSAAGMPARNGRGLGGLRGSLADLRQLPTSSCPPSGPPFLFESSPIDVRPIAVYEALAAPHITAVVAGVDALFPELDLSHTFSGNSADATQGSAADRAHVKTTTKKKRDHVRNLFRKGIAGVSVTRAMERPGANGRTVFVGMQSLRLYELRSGAYFMHSDGATTERSNVDMHDVSCVPTELLRAEKVPYAVVLLLRQVSQRAAGEGFGGESGECEESKKASHGVAAAATSSTSSSGGGRTHSHTSNQPLSSSSHPPPSSDVVQQEAVLVALAKLHVELDGDLLEIAARYADYVLGLVRSVHGAADSVLREKKDNRYPSAPRVPHQRSSPLPPTVVTTMKLLAADVGLHVRFPMPARLRTGETKDPSHNGDNAKACDDSSHRPHICDSDITTPPDAHSLKDEEGEETHYLHRHPQLHRLLRHLCAKSRRYSRDYAAVTANTKQSTTTAPSAVCLAHEKTPRFLAEQLQATLRGLDVTTAADGSTHVTWAAAAVTIVDPVAATSRDLLRLGDGNCGGVSLLIRFTDLLRAGRVRHVQHFHAAGTDGDRGGGDDHGCGHHRNGLEAPQGLRRVMTVTVTGEEVVTEPLSPDDFLLTRYLLWRLQRDFRRARRGGDGSGDGRNVAPGGILRAEMTARSERAPIVSSNAARRGEACAACAMRTGGAPAAATAATTIMADRDGSIAGQQPAAELVSAPTSAVPISRLVDMLGSDTSLTAELMSSMASGYRVATAGAAAASVGREEFTKTKGRGHPHSGHDAAARSPSTPRSSSSSVLPSNAVWWSETASAVLLELRVQHVRVTLLAPRLSPQGMPLGEPLLRCLSPSIAATTNLALLYHRYELDVCRLSLLLLACDENGSHRCTEHSGLHREDDDDGMRHRSPAPPTLDVSVRVTAVDLVEVIPPLPHYPQAKLVGRTVLARSYVSGAGLAAKGAGRGGVGASSPGAAVGVEMAEEEDAAAKSSDGYVLCDDGNDEVGDDGYVCRVRVSSRIGLATTTITADTATPKLLSTPPLHAAFKQPEEVYTVQLELCRLGFHHVPAHLGDGWLSVLKSFFVGRGIRSEDAEEEEQPRATVKPFASNRSAAPRARRTTTDAPSSQSISSAAPAAAAHRGPVDLLSVKLTITVTDVLWAYYPQEEHAALLVALAPNVVLHVSVPDTTVDPLINATCGMTRPASLYLCDDFSMKELVTSTLNVTGRGWGVDLETAGFVRVADIRAEPTARGMREDNGRGGCGTAHQAFPHSSTAHGSTNRGSDANSPTATTRATTAATTCTATTPVATIRIDRTPNADTPTRVRIAGIHMCAFAAPDALHIAAHMLTRLLTMRDLAYVALPHALVMRSNTQGAFAWVGDEVARSCAPMSTRINEELQDLLYGSKERERQEGGGGEGYKGHAVGDRRRLPLPSFPSVTSASDMTLVGLAHATDIREGLPATCTREESTGTGSTSDALPVEPFRLWRRSNAPPSIQTRHAYAHAMDTLLRDDWPPQPQPRERDSDGNSLRTREERAQHESLQNGAEPDAVSGASGEERDDNGRRGGSTTRSTEAPELPPAAATTHAGAADAGAVAAVSSSKCSSFASISDALAAPDTVVWHVRARLAQNPTPTAASSAATSAPFNLCAAVTRDPHCFSGLLRRAQRGPAASEPVLARRIPFYLARVPAVRTAAHGVSYSDTNGGATNASSADAKTATRPASVRRVLPPVALELFICQCSADITLYGGHDLTNAATRRRQRGLQAVAQRAAEVTPSAACADTAVNEHTGQVPSTHDVAADAASTDTRRGRRGRRDGGQIVARLRGASLQLDTFAAGAEEQQWLHLLVDECTVDDGIARSDVRRLLAATPGRLGGWGASSSSLSQRFLEISWLTLLPRHAPALTTGRNHTGTDQGENTTQNSRDGVDFTQGSIPLSGAAGSSNPEEEVIVSLKPISVTWSGASLDFLQRLVSPAAASRRREGESGADEARHRGRHRDDDGATSLDSDSDWVTEEYPRGGTDGLIGARVKCTNTASTKAEVVMFQTPPLYFRRFTLRSTTITLSGSFDSEAGLFHALAHGTRVDVLRNVPLLSWLTVRQLPLSLPDVTVEDCGTPALLVQRLVTDSRCLSLRFLLTMCCCTVQPLPAVVRIAEAAGGLLLAPMARYRRSEAATHALAAASTMLAGELVAQSAHVGAMLTNNTHRASRALLEALVGGDEGRGGLPLSRRTASTTTSTGSVQTATRTVGGATNGATAAVDASENPYVHESSEEEQRRRVFHRGQQQPRDLREGLQAWQLELEASAREAASIASYAIGADGRLVRLPAAGLRMLMGASAGATAVLRGLRNEHSTHADRQAREWGVDIFK